MSTMAITNPEVDQEIAGLVTKAYEMITSHWRAVIPSLKTTKRGAPAYMIIYGKKVAIISLSQGRPHSVVIEDTGLAETQKLVFDSLWDKLAKETG